MRYPRFCWEDSSSCDPSATLSLLTGGMILAGVLLLLISRVAHRIAMWFTPLVTGSFMLLLSFHEIIPITNKFML
ncbi:solute carrier family 23 protein [Brevibacillus centrosporus]|jgi:xanthine/uracil permease